MAFAPYAACVNKQVRGCFKEAAHGHFFEYAAPETGEFIPFPGYELKVYCGPLGEFRWAKVIASRAYVAIDEAADGQPVVEKWIIRNHRRYDAA